MGANERGWDLMQIWFIWGLFFLDFVSIIGLKGVSVDNCLGNLSLIHFLGKTYFVLWGYFFCLGSCVPPVAHLLKGRCRGIYSLREIRFVQ